MSQLTPEERTQLTPEERAALEYYGYGDPQPIKHEPRFPLLRKLAAPVCEAGGQPELALGPATGPSPHLLLR